MKKLVAIILAAGAVALLAVSVSVAECGKKCCSPQSATTESKDPTKQEVVVDPVCGMDVTVGKDTLSQEYKGKTYYFCSKSCKESFAKDPSKYIGGTSK